MFHTLDFGREQVNVIFQILFTRRGLTSPEPAVSILTVR